MTKISKPFWIVLAIFFISYLFLILRLHFNYSTTDSDLAIYDQQVWFLSQFKLPNSSFKDNFNAWGDHFGLIEIFIAPLYWFWESAVVLIILQEASIVLSAVPIYLTFKKYLKTRELWPLVFVIIYLLYFGFQSATIFPFHLATLSVVFIAWTIYAVLFEKWLLYWPMLILTLITKEDLPLFGIVLGILLIVRKKYWVGIITFLASTFYFYLVTSVIIPFFAHRKYSYFVSQLGNSPTEIVINSLLNPVKGVVYFFTPLIKLRTMVAMFASFGFMTFFSPTFLFLLTPFLASRFLNDTLQRHMPWMHYSANQGPLLAFGAILGIYNLLPFIQRLKLPKPIGTNFIPLVLSLSLIASLLVTFNYQMPLLKLLDLKFYSESGGASNVREALKLIPGNASVATQSGLQPHLSARDEIYIYPDAARATDGREDDLPEEAKPEEYAMPPSQYLLMSVDAFHWRPVSREEFARQIDYVKSLPDWEIIYDKEGTTLLRKRL